MTLYDNAFSIAVIFLLELMGLIRHLEYNMKRH